jgi:hypothetical protein
VVLLRPDDDVQVEFHVAGKRGSPFEQLFTVADEPVDAAASTIAEFVRDLLSERSVLVVREGPLGARRDFIPAGDSDRIRKASWCASFLATFDHHLDS